jgi:AbiV family abortive infection protein
MRLRATPKLASLPEDRLLPILAEGLPLIAKHVAALASSAEHQAGPSAVRGANAIQVVATEEAGKYLVLLDAIRCARTSQKIKARQLRRFGDHVAKGIYAKVTDWSPATFREILRYIDRLRQSHYLDGPSDVDWIFRNEIEAEREELLYIDYVETDEGDRWVSPQQWRDGLGVDRIPDAVRLVAAMNRAGFGKPETLSIIVDVWDGFVPNGDTHWQVVRDLNVTTINRMNAAGIDIELNDARVICDRWTFPLHHADLESVKVDLEDLRRQQREWTYDW